VVTVETVAEIVVIEEVYNIIVHMEIIIITITLSQF
jgi:hypothetical protein